MNIFNYIKSRVSIWDVVNEYATLKRAGTYWKARCPFHHEKTASFTVSPGKEIFYCFGCHEGGDVISFIAKIENCSQIEAAEFLADRYNLELPDDIEAAEGSTENKQRYFEICELVAQWCHEQLKKNPSITHYLTSRDIDEQQINYFMLGYFPGGLPSIKNLIHDMKKKHVLMEDLIASTIISQGKTVLYSAFEDRVIFPIKDHLGRFCAFGGRIVRPQDTRAKYYNSRENDFFTKGSVLFGLDVAKKAIQDNDAVFLVEGYTDCIAMVHHGYTNTVATLGTACTPAHLKILSRYASYLYVLYDSDAAGQKAILRLTQLCWQANMELKVIQLPTSQDPASYLQAGNDLNTRIEAAQDIFEFYIESLGKGFSLKPLHTKVGLIKSVIETIQSVKEPLKIDILLQKASTTCNIPFETLKNELNRLQASMDKAAPEQEPSQPPVANQGPAELEKQIFCAIINNVDLLNRSQESYLISYMPDPLGDILKKLKSILEQTSSFEFTHFFDTLSQSEKQYVSKLLLEHEESISRESFQQLVIQFHKKRWKQIVQNVQTKLARAKQEGDEETFNQIIRDFQQLKQKIVPAIMHGNVER